jgi:cytidine deaminase
LQVSDSRGSAGALLAAATEAMRRAYAPYSSFRVGAAIADADGRIFIGCNVENAAYGSTLCAERVALCSAVAQGSRSFERIVIVTDGATPAPPCGACRQVLAELSPRLEVHSITLEGVEERWSLESLLPAAFSSNSLTTR